VATLHGFSRGTGTGLKPLRTGYLFMKKIDENSSQPALIFSKTLDGKTRFPLMQALAGRRSRRFCLGADIPESPLAFKSNQKPFPLTEPDQMVVFTSMAGSPEWH
jgi:hypothetical protein